jgi:lysophospholipase L1-like esterase
MFIDIDCSNYPEDIFWAPGQSADKKISTSITKDKVNIYFCDTRSIKEETQNLDKYLSGKTIVCFGDSLTEFKDNDGLGYCDYINLISGANIINVGCGGAQIRQRIIPVLNPTSSNEGYAGMDLVNIVRASANVPFDDTHTYRDVVYNAAQYIETTIGDDNTLIIERLLAINWNKVDAVTFLCGTNDWFNGGNTRGVSGSTDENTTLGAINVIIQTLLTAYPHLSIYWFTPTVRWASNIVNRNDANWCDTIVYNGYSLKQLSEAIKNEVELQHLPVCDLYNTLGWNKFNFSQYFIDTDGTHPIKGYRQIAEKIVSFIIANRVFKC